MQTVMDVQHGGFKFFVIFIVHGNHYKHFFKQHISYQLDKGFRLVYELFMYGVCVCMNWCMYELSYADEKIIFVFIW